MYITVLGYSQGVLLECEHRTYAACPHNVAGWIRGSLKPHFMGQNSKAKTILDPDILALLLSFH